jgi:hypothetical protein
VRAKAEVFRREMERTERAGKRAFARAVRSGEAIGFNPLYGRDPEHAFGAYLRRMIDDDLDLRESTRELYLRRGGADTVTQRAAGGLRLRSRVSSPPAAWPSRCG